MLMFLGFGDLGNCPFPRISNVVSHDILGPDSPQAFEIIYTVTAHYVRFNALTQNMESCRFTMTRQLLAASKKHRFGNIKMSAWV